jgi:DNA-binding CsgD family transcriptional regulator
VSVLRAIASVVNIAEILPLPTAEQVRRKLHQGIALRWILIAVIAAGVMLTPTVAGLVLSLLAAASIYNATIMLALARATATSERRIALAVTIIDHLFCFTFLGIYASHVASSQPLGGYSMGTIEAIFYFGVPGAILSLGIFVVCALAAHGLDLPLFGHTFDGPGIVNSILLLGMIAVCLVAAWRVRLVAGGEEAVPTETTVLVASPNGKPAIRLSRREREVLNLVAEGYSNTMIANRLRISDSTVKGYVENLLFHLNARNRAEAVAAAARLKLL